LLLKGDIVKVVCSDGSDKLGLISEVVDDTMIRIAMNWFDLTDCEVTVLHREVDTA
jgi:hypothetical protein